MEGRKLKALSLVWAYTDLSEPMQWGLPQSIIGFSGAKEV